MDFSLTEEQTILLDSLDRFCRNEIQPRVEEWDRKKVLRDPAVLKDLFKKLQPFGAVSGPVPERYGGMGLDYLTTGLILEKLAEYWGAMWGVCLIQAVGARLLSEIENEEIKERYLPLLCKGERVVCACITEPNVGSNPAFIQTTIKKANGGYRLNGAKTWISNGSVSDMAFVLASVDVSQGMQGIGFVLVDRLETPYEARELEKMGLRAFPTSELVFDDIFVPEDNLIVRPGGGLKTTFRAFELARSLMAAGSVGFGRAAISLATRYAQEREQSGRKIGSFQLIQQMVADMRARTDASAFLSYRALWMMDQGQRCEAESSLGKAYSTEAAVLTTRECVQILGGYGLSEEYAAERYYRDASCMTIPDGTTQIQKMIVARSMLGGLNAFV